MNPDKVVLKGVLVRMSTLIASRQRIVQVISRRLDLVIMIGHFPLPNYDLYTLKWSKSQWMLLMSLPR